MPYSKISLDNVAIVVVLYLPSEEDLNHISNLAEWGVGVHVVVNLVNAAEPWPSIKNVHWIKNPKNFGLARALNQGISSAIATGSQYILLLDQDSRPLKEMLCQLVAAAAKIESEGRRLACVAPSLHEKKAIRTANHSEEFAVGATFATSGTLLTRQGWNHVGPMWEALFIDGIDHEWCFRAVDKGFETVFVQEAEMEHDMGESSISLLGRVRPIHRSPNRHYFIVRNTLWLQKKSYIPMAWRLTQLVKLAYRIPTYILTTKDRKKTLVNILTAISDGITGRERQQPA